MRHSFVVFSVICSFRDRNGTKLRGCKKLGSPVNQINFYILKQQFKKNCMKISTWMVKFKIHSSSSSLSVIWNAWIENLLKGSNLGVISTAYKAIKASLRTCILLSQLACRILTHIIHFLNLDICNLHSRNRGEISHNAGQGCRLQASSCGLGRLLLSHKESDTWTWVSRLTQWKMEYLKPKKWKFRH